MFRTKNRNIRRWLNNIMLSSTSYVWNIRFLHWLVIVPCRLSSYRVITFVILLVDWFRINVQICKNLSKLIVFTNSLDLLRVYFKPKIINQRRGRTIHHIELHFISTIVRYRSSEINCCFINQSHLSLNKTLIRIDVPIL